MTVLNHSYDDTTRTVTTLGPSGEVTSTRAYTAEENATADAAAAAAQAAEMEAIRTSVDRAILDAIRHVSETVHADGEAWVQPTGAHDAYPIGAKATLGGKTWESLVPANVWKPPTNWREVATVPAWVQPTGAGDAYDLGAKVTFEGHVWESLIPANTWSPAAYPAGWQLIS